MDIRVSLPEVVERIKKLVKVLTDSQIEYYNIIDHTDLIYSQQILQSSTFSNSLDYQLLTIERVFFFFFFFFS